MKPGRAGHGSLLSPEKPPRTLATVGGRERGRSIPFATNLTCPDEVRFQGRSRVDLLVAANMARAI